MTSDRVIRFDGIMTFACVHCKEINHGPGTFTFCRKPSTQEHLQRYVCKGLQTHCVHCGEINSFEGELFQSLIPPEEEQQ